MSIYSDALDALQRTGLHGVPLTHAEHANLLAVVRARTAEVTAVRLAITTANSSVATQTDILAGIGGGSATAGTAIAALMATLVAAKPTADALVTNAVIDGVW